MNSIRSQKIENFLVSLSSSSPTPGGGAVAALTGAFAASLVEMVANLTIGKKGYEKVNTEILKIRNEALILKRELLKLADADVKAFNGVMAAYKSKNESRIKKSLQKATDIPSKVLSLSKKIEKMAGRMAKIGNKYALSDAKSAIHLSRASQKAAYENVIINTKALAALK